MEEFIGRFHPLLVHLPIGFILLAFLLETLSFFVQWLDGSRKTVALMYFVGFIASLAAITSGWLLSESGTYGIGDLSTHKWLGFAVTVLVGALALAKWKPQWLSAKQSYALSLILVLLVPFTGHYGGVLTHGNDYLYERAPGWVQRMAGFEPADDLSLLATMPPDSVGVYVNVVQPVLEAKCVQCHNDDDPSGGFNAARYSTLFDEGETGTAISPGSLAGSELFKRITLPTSSKRFMPPNGHPISYTELKIMRYWIEQGADSAARFDYAAMDAELAGMVRRDYALDFSPKPYYEKVAVDSLDPQVLKQLTASGFEAIYLGGTNYLLDVRFTGDTLRAGDMEQLSAVSGHVTFLNLSGLVMEGELVSPFKDFTHLTRLDLHGSQVSDNVFLDFDQLAHLEVLNLFQTPITEKGFEQALTSPGLKRVYVWQTKIPEATIDKAEVDHPGITFERGFTFMKSDTTSVSASTP